MVRNCFRWLHVSATGVTRGQSLVEMALMMPLLLLFFLGVFEIGYALRGYLVLVNVNREITRFAVRPNYLDFSEADLNIDSVGYDNVANHVFTVLGANPDTKTGGELPIEYGVNTTLIISHIVADTNQPCEDINNCTCSWFDTLAYRDPSFANASKVKLDDDDLRHPGQPGQEFQARKYPETSPLETKLDYEAYTLELARQNDKFNCELLKKSSTTVPSVNNVIVTELFYSQPQLVGFPIISNSVTDPIPMYSHTAMRLTAGARGNTADTVGPGCIAYPITFPELADPDNIPQIIDAFEGTAVGNFGWLSWNGTGNAVYTEKILGEPLYSKNEYTDDQDPNDHNLSIGDDVSANTGVSDSSGIIALLHGLEGKTILVPVYNYGASSVGGSGGYYRITHFARVKIEQICLPSDSCAGGGSDKRITATFLGYHDDICVDDVSGGAGGGGGNTAPVANNDTGSTVKNTAVTINVLSNDTDADGDTLTVTNINYSAADFASVTNNGNGTVTATPKNNATGTFSFTYDITDGNGGTASASVTVTVTATAPVNNPPVAGNDSATTTAGTAVTINAAANDSDPNGDALTWGNPSAPAHGTAVHNGNGSYTYTPTAGYTGGDSFTYQVSDGRGGTATGTVSITVNAAPVANRPPVAGDDSATTTANTLVTINVNANDSDPDGDGLVYTATPVSGPSHGTAAYETFGKFRYTPTTGYTGSDSFVYQISDGRGGTDTATVSITVNAPVNVPPVAVDDAATTRKNNTISINVLANDTDSNGDTLIISGYTPVTGGTLTLAGDSRSFTYTAPNQRSTFTFNYTVSDGKGGTDTALVTITVN